MLYRRQIRLAVVEALTLANIRLEGVDVAIESPGDWNAEVEALPVVMVRTSLDNKESIIKGPPEFKSGLQVDVRAVVGASTAEAAQDLIEELWGRVENAILKSPAVLKASQQVSTITSSLDIRSDSKQHLAGINGGFVFEATEVYDATADDFGTFDNMTQITLDADLANRFDGAGTYPSPLFPSAVVPAPRESGPDGRPEGGLDLTLTGA